jgi:hypothetical protein
MADVVRDEPIILRKKIDDRLRRLLAVESRLRRPARRRCVLTADWFNALTAGHALPPDAEHEYASADSSCCPA